MGNAARPTRRQLLQGLAAAAGVAAVAGVTPWQAQSSARAAGLILPPGTRPDPSKPEGVDTMPQVEHVIIYMQENHSYDNYFGMLGRGDGFTLGPGGVPNNTNPDLQDQPVSVFPIQGTCDPNDGAGQSWNSSHIEWNNGANDGFIRAANGATGSMGYWDGSTIPFYYGLANTFVLCDRWFASVLGQTFPNRRYLQAATSVGIVSTNVQEVVATPVAPNGVIWERLDAHGISWADYAVDLADIALFPGWSSSHGDKVKTFNDFLLDCANGTLPQVSIISPGDQKWSEEDADVQNGEAYSSSLINAVLHSPAWSKTVLFFTYDEHGGYYDHVPPPPAVAPDDILPRITVPPDQPGAFDRYGFRVPSVVVSPFAKKGYVSSVVHDHTSILKFIETKFNLGALTYRDANADDLLDTLDFANPGFLDPPVLPAPGLPATGSACQPQPIPPTQATTTTTTSTTSTTSTSTSTTTTVPGSGVAATGASSGSVTPAFTG